MTGRCLPPPVPPDADLTDFKFMPLEVVRLRRSRSWLICRRKPHLGFYMLNLWATAWHERPAGSLEPDDDVLSDAAMCSPEKWAKVRADVMRGWYLASDGRLYHPVVAEKVFDAWEAKLLARWSKECDRIRKENKKRLENQGLPILDPLPIPEKPRLERPVFPDDGDGIPAEIALKGREGKGDLREEERTPVAEASLLTPREAAASDEDRAFAGWQAVSGTHRWPDAQFMTSNRRYKLQAILAICGGLDGWKAALVHAATTANFLKTADGQWQRWFHLDWMLNIDNFTKLMEGRYAEHHTDEKPNERSLLAGLAGLAEGGAR